METPFIVNLFGGPCAGKSTMASGVFYSLKKHRVQVEYVTEYAKDLTWEGRHIALANQPYIFGKQLQRIYRVVNQVDVIITDTSILYCTMYAPKDYYNHWEPFVFQLFNDMNNLNYFIERVQPYETIGRNQTEEQADGVASEMFETLNSYGVEMKRCLPGNEVGCDIMTRDILNELGME
jgi:nicotinamide riboside kinase